MRKTMRLLRLLALPILIGMTSCSDDDVNEIPAPVIVDEATDAPEKVVPTTDQMEVRVTSDLLTAVPSAFEEGSTGAALVKRLPMATANIDGVTRLVLFKGSDFEENSTALSSDLITGMLKAYLNGGYIAIERPTTKQLGVFGLLFVGALLEMEELTLEELFDMTDEEAMAVAAQSPHVKRLQARLDNLNRIATRANDTNDGNELFAEMVILGTNDYFIQEPLKDKVTSTVYSENSNGLTTEAEILETPVERTAYISGQLADAAAKWLNDTEQKSQTRASFMSLASTRADGETAINELMDASETFTLSGNISYRDNENLTYTKYGIVTHTFRSWGVHDMDGNKDYYYIKQNVLLRLSSLFDCGDFGKNQWYKSKNYRGYDRWYGAYLSQFNTSMQLNGVGGITLEEATPYTDNNNTNTTISVGTSSGYNVGISTGVNVQGYNLGTSFGFTSSHSFTTGTTTFSKDLAVAKNTSGREVSWTYKAGSLPKAYVETTGSVWSGYTYNYCHSAPADILVNDCDINNLACWSVSNPEGSYKFYTNFSTQTAALLYSYDNADDDEIDSKTEYTDTENLSYEHTLLTPNRATQTWSMSVSIDKWIDNQVVGAKAQLESTLAEKYPDAFKQRFNVADQTATSVNTITNFIKYSRSVFENYYNDLQEYAADLGVRTFTIRWKCNTSSLSPKEGFMVTVPNFMGTVLLSSLTSNYETQDGEVLTGKLEGKYKITVADGAKVTLENVSISNEPSRTQYPWAGITCLGDATIILKGNNSVEGFYEDYPGIFVPEGSTLTIEGDGSLTATSGRAFATIPFGFAPGIGGSRVETGGNIVINSGTIEATGGNWSAGIGSSYNMGCGDITINGGNITATGGYACGSKAYGPGIGAGPGTYCGDITINGGTVKATANDNSAGIGSGWQGRCGNITITDGVVSVTATKGNNCNYSIGAGLDGSCGTITIGGSVTTGITDSPYTYKP